MKPDTDIAILGGGCAGLSLAVALSRAAPHLRVQVLEERTRYVRDRTWCYWNTEPHPFESCVSHSWARWRVSANGRQVEQQSSRYAYQHIPADRFYDYAQKCMENSPLQELTLGVRVRTVNAAGGMKRVETEQGSILARRVFDSRPASRLLPEDALVQRFTGWHVRTNRVCFDPTTVDLMDFQQPGAAARAAFFYLLPFAENEALVEVTYLDSVSLPFADAESELKRKMEELTSGSGCAILFREQACLPMFCVKAAPHSIGTYGGRVKPSSGYAFLRIQRQSQALAAALARGAEMPERYEARLYGLLDRVFLEVLRSDLPKAPRYFVPLFEHVPADTLVRFLSETGPLAEAAPVVRALPKRPFLQACFRLAFVSADFMAARLLVFALFVAAACLSVMTPLVLVCTLAAISIAVWHGAYDGILAKPFLEKRLGPTWAASFAAGYLLLAAAMVLLWFVSPRLALPAFLLYSAWHFGSESQRGGITFAGAAVGLCLGAIPIAAACHWHMADVSAIFTALLRGSSQQMFAYGVASVAGHLLWPAVLVAAAGVLRGGREIGSLTLIALELFLFRQCNPLVAFGVFFCIWHAPEHLLSNAHDGGGRFSLPLMSQQLRSGVVPWLISLAALGCAVACGPRNWLAYASALFIMLSALTVPHMALNEVRRILAS